MDHGHAGAEDYKQDIDYQLLSELNSLFCEEVVMVCPLYAMIADNILTQNNINSTTSFEEARNVYILLVETFAHL